MPEPLEALTERIRRLLQPEFRGRLRARGLARSIIWRAGALPPGASEFSEELTDDLLDYGHALLAQALRLRARSGDPLAEVAFLVAGEALEAAVHRGAPTREQAFHRITGASAFHLARYAARAYSLLSSQPSDDNYSPSERCLAQLLVRSLRPLRATYINWLVDPANEDTTIAERLQAGVISPDTAIQLVLTSSFMRALAVFEHALDVGAAGSAQAARELLLEGASTASEHGFVPSWWLHTIAAHLVGDLWAQSLHVRLPNAPPIAEHDRWPELRDRFINMLRARERAEIELWPSQVEAARRSADPLDNLVVALPTSAGKTRIAELCILRALSLQQRVVYLTPLRALSAQVERGLSATFMPLGFTVSSLYGASGSAADVDSLARTQVVVATPEKLDFALRSHPEILDDIGLIVLDEGHMIGPDEREIRYEALIQRLLRRPDADRRRIVCLSALFPENEEFTDFVKWLRRDVEGDPIRSTWRPTRQRFGIVRWWGDHARLDLSVDQETPFVDRYIESEDAPEGSTRKGPFPRDKNDLTLATAWRACEADKQVMIYVPLRASVETLGNAVVKLRRQKCLPSLLNEKDTEAIQMAEDIGVEWLGPDHPAVTCLRHGVALHHGGLPRAFLAEVERLLRTGVCRVVISSPTLAQGVNLSASTLIIPSIWRNKQKIRPEEFANVAGRAGRAYVDLDGVVLHIVHEADRGRARWAIAQWNELVGAARARKFVSGILALVASLIQRIISTHPGLTTADKSIEYITAHAAVWDYRPLQGQDEDELSDEEWQRRVASVDAAILAFIENTEVAEDALPQLLDEVLKHSLWDRHLARRGDDFARVCRALLQQRARTIWSASAPAQRRGYYRAGVGLAAGKYLDEHGVELLGNVLAAEQAVREDRRNDAADAIAAAAKRLHHVPPFSPRDEVSDAPAVLRGWISGDSMAGLTAIGGDRTSDFIQDGVVYRLTWGLEAVRLWAEANGQALHANVDGTAAVCCETGTANLTEALLMRAGLSSRAAAAEAVERTAAKFKTVQAMNEWLETAEVRELSSDDNFPSAATHSQWVDFFSTRHTARARAWVSSSREVPVDWVGPVPAEGSEVRIVRRATGQTEVRAPDMTLLGSTPEPLHEPRVGSIRVRVASANALRVDTFAAPAA